MEIALQLDPHWGDYIPGLLALVLWAVFGAGLFAWIERKRPSVGPSFALGCAAMVPLQMALVLAGWGSGTLFVSAAAAIVGAVLLHRRGFLRVRALRIPDWPVLLVAGVAILPWSLALPSLLRPHVNYDVLSYHLELAHRFRESLGFVEGNYYSRLPAASFLLYAPFLSVRDASLDDPAVRLLGWAAWVAMALCAGRVAGHLGARPLYRWVACALVGWHGLAWEGLLNAHNDLLVGLLGVAALERLLSAIPRRSVASFALAGWLASTAMAVKFSAAGVVVAPLFVAAIVALAMHRPRLAPRAIAAPLIGFLAGCAGGYGPWAIRAWWLGGHPLHPFRGEAPGWTAEQALFVVEQHRPQGPLDASYWFDVGAKLPVFGFEVPYTSISALFLFALVSALVARRARIVLLSCALGYCAWLTVALAPTRFLFPVVGWMAAAVPLVLARRDFRPQARVFLGALLGVSLLAQAGSLVPSLLATLDSEVWERGRIVPEDIPLSAHSAEGGTLLLFEARTRWFPSAQLAHTVWDAPPWAQDLRESDDARDFAERLSAAGIGTVVVNEVEFGRLVAFYGGLPVEWQRGALGLDGDQQEYLDALAAHPPHRFAGLERRDLEVLLEFLHLSRQRPLHQSRRGEHAVLWIAPLPVTPERTSE